MLTEIDHRVRFTIYQVFAEGGKPSAALLAARLHLPQPAVYESLDRLKKSKIVILDSHTKEVKVAMPFSAAPTPCRVTAGDRTWYACSAWDAFGIPHLLNCDAVMATTCPCCEGPIVHRVEQQRLIDDHGVAHFAVPAAHWWDNITYSLETIRFFRSAEHVQTWSAQAETPIGEIMPIAALWELSHLWFDGRLSAEWRPRPRELSQELLREAGFTGPFWSLTG